MGKELPVSETQALPKNSHIWPLSSALRRVKADKGESNYFYEKYEDDEHEDPPSLGSYGAANEDDKVG
jgi:hypothetical protein